LAKAESTAENLSIILAGLNVETGEAIKRISILAGQLKKASLFLIIAREEKVIMTPKNECTICRLIISQTKDNATQTIEITC
jgi:hypothetical protein